MFFDVSAHTESTLSQHPLSPGVTDSKGMSEQIDMVEPSLSQHLLPESEQTAVTPDATVDSSASLSQYPLGETVDDQQSTLPLSQHPLTEMSSDYILLQQSLGNSGRSSNGSDASNFSGDAESIHSGRSVDDLEVGRRKSQDSATVTLASKDSLSQHMISSTCSSIGVSDEAAVKGGIAAMDSGTREYSISQASGESTDCLAMYSTRPGTVLDRMGSVPPEPGSSHSRPDSGEGVKTAAVEPPKTVSAEHFPSTEGLPFDQSIKYMHGVQPSSLGDTLPHCIKDPVTSSTPYGKKSESQNPEYDAEPATSSNGMTLEPVKALDEEVVGNVESLNGSDDNANQDADLITTRGSANLTTTASLGFMASEDFLEIAESGPKFMTPEDHLQIGSIGSSSSSGFPMPADAQVAPEQTSSHPLSTSTSSGSIQSYELNPERKDGSGEGLTPREVLSREAMADIVASESLALSTFRDEAQPVLIRGCSSFQTDFSGMPSRHGNDPEIMGASSAEGEVAASHSGRTPSPIGSDQLESRHTDPKSLIRDEHVARSREDSHQVSAGLDKDYGEPGSSRASSSLSQRLAALLAAEAPEHSLPKDPSALGEAAGATLLVGGNFPPSSEMVLLDSLRSESDAEDLRRLTGEYKAQLKEHLAGLSGTESANSSAREESHPDAPSTVKLGIESFPPVHTDQLRLVPPPAVGVIIGLPQDEGGSNCEVKISSRASISSADTDDSLERDVKRILAKYGRNLSDSEDEALPSVRYPQVSLSEPEDEMHRQVKTLLKGMVAISSRSASSGRENLQLPAYLFDDPSKSMSLPIDAQSTTSQDTQPTDAHKISKDLSGFLEESSDVSNAKTTEEQESSHIQSRFRGALAEESSYFGTELPAVDPTETQQGRISSSRTSSRKSSNAGSVDYAHLQKDLDEIQVNLHDLDSWKKGEVCLTPRSGPTVAGSAHSSQASQRPVGESEGGNTGSIRSESLNVSEQLQHSSHSRSGSNISQQPAADTKSMMKGTGPDGHDVTVLKTTEPSVLTGQVDRTDHADYTLTTKIGDSAYKGDMKLGAHTLLTSGLVPLDVALDIVHGTNYASTHRTQPEDFNSLIRSSSSGQRSEHLSSAAAGQCSEHLSSAAADSRNDLEEELIQDSARMLHTAVSDERSFTERVSDIMERESPPRQAYAYLREAALTTAEASAVATKSGTLPYPYDAVTIIGAQEDRGTETGKVSDHFSPFRNARSLFSTQLDKVSKASFDTSVEMRHPVEQPLQMQTIEDVLEEPPLRLPTITSVSGRDVSGVDQSTRTSLRPIEAARGESVEVYARTSSPTEERLLGSLR